MKKGFLLQGSSTTTNAGRVLGPLQDPRSIGSSDSGEKVPNTDSCTWEPWPITKHWQSDPPVAAGKDECRQQLREDKGCEHNFISNPYANVAMTPAKTSGVPMNALNTFFASTKGELYQTWDNNPERQIDLLFSSAFLSPLTGEIFLAGAWDGAQVKRTTDDGLRWFKNKKAAEHGAAARAFDCLSLRRREERMSEYEEKISKGITGAVPPGPLATIGKEEPYLACDAIYSIPDTVPVSVRELVTKMQESIGNQPSIPEVHSPKQFVQNCFAKHPRRIEGISQYYHTWHSGDVKQQNLQFTSLFVSPLTGELFLACSWLGGQGIYSSDNSLWWFNAKNKAENGAAARAHDCISLRDDSATVCQLTEEGPYLESSAIYEVPESVPDFIRRQVERQQVIIGEEAQRLQKSSLHDNAVYDLVDGEEMAWHRRPDDVIVDFHEFNDDDG